MTIILLRDVAQLVAHYVRDVGVGRSSRLIPTERQQEFISCCLFSFYTQIIKFIYVKNLRNNVQQKPITVMAKPLYFLKFLIIYHGVNSLQE